MNAAEVIEKARRVMERATDQTNLAIVTSQAHGAVGALEDLGLITLGEWEDEVSRINRLSEECAAAIEDKRRQEAPMPLTTEVTDEHYRAFIVGKLLPAIDDYSEASGLTLEQIDVMAITALISLLKDKVSDGYLLSMIDPIFGRTHEAPETLQ